MGCTGSTKALLFSLSQTVGKKASHHENAPSSAHLLSRVINIIQAPINPLIHALLKISDNLKTKLRVKKLSALQANKPLTCNYGRKKICSKCGKSYSRQDNLTRHVKYECGVLPRFKCIYCPHRSKRKSHMERHVLYRHKDQKLAIKMDLDAL